MRLMNMMDRLNREFTYSFLFFFLFGMRVKIQRPETSNSPASIVYDSQITCLPSSYMPFSRSYFRFVHGDVCI